MRILVVHPGSGWILSTIAQRTYEAMPHAFALTAIGNACVIGPEIGGILYVDIQNCWFPNMRQMREDIVHVGMFTHLDKDSSDSFRPGWEKLDGVIHMAQRYFDCFVKNGWYPPERMTVLRPGQVADKFSLKKVRIGICQRGEHVGKGRDFLPQVIREIPQEIKDGMGLWFKGKGWVDLSKIADRTVKSIDAVWYEGVRCIVDDNEASDSYPAFYRQIDYLLIPSLWDGGPMALLEALACGIPVISSDVGWVREVVGDIKKGNIHAEGSINIFPFLDDLYIYPPDSIECLAEILTWIVGTRIDRRNTVSGMSYVNYAAGVLKFFEHLKEMR